MNCPHQRKIKNILSSSKTKIKLDAAYIFKYGKIEQIQQLAENISIVNQLKLVFTYGIDIRCCDYTKLDEFMSRQPTKTNINICNHICKSKDKKQVDLIIKHLCVNNILNINNLRHITKELCQEIRKDLSEFLLHNITYIEIKFFAESIKNVDDELSYLIFELRNHYMGIYTTVNEQDSEFVRKHKNYQLYWKTIYKKWKGLKLNNDIVIRIADTIEVKKDSITIPHNRFKELKTYNNYTINKYIKDQYKNTI